MKSFSLVTSGLVRAPRLEGNRLFPYLSVGNGLSGTSSTPMLADAVGQTTMMVCLAATPLPVAGTVTMLGTTCVLFESSTIAVKVTVAVWLTGGLAVGLQ